MLLLLEISFAISINLLIGMMLYVENITSGKKNGSVFYLSAFLVVSFLCLGAYPLTKTKLILEIPHFYRVPAVLFFLISPFHYLYVRSVVTAKRPKSIITFIHLFPFLLVCLNYLPFFILGTAEKREILNQVTTNLANSWQFQDGFLNEVFILSVRFLLSFTYLFFSWRLLVSLDRKYALRKKRNLQIRNWLVFLNIYMTVYIILQFALYLFKYLNPSEEVATSPVLRFLALTLGFNLLSLMIYFFWNRHVFTDVSNLTLKPETLPRRGVMPVAELKELLRPVMQLEKFKDENFDLKGLLDLVPYSEEQVRRIMQAHSLNTFRDFLNVCRVDYAMGLMKDNYLERYSMDSLAEQAGFSSRSTFYRAFKKRTGRTPGEQEKELT